MKTTRKSILILDDSPLILEIVREALEREGFDVTLAGDLRDLDRRITGASPSLILIDVNMPEAFGDDVGQVLREVRKLTAPIWLFSNLDDPALEQRAREAGLDGFISKRSGIESFVRRVREILNGGGAAA